jgi:hypothetical protein
MHLRQTQETVHVPGNATPTVRRTAEWLCLECDYFEEAEEEGA